MLRPDRTFHIVVSPTVHLTPCAAMLEQQRRGLFGFHLFASCPDCHKEYAGFQCWGENGHLQGSASDRAGLVRWIGYKARQQWRSVDGSLLGYRFSLGGRIFIR